MPAPRTVPRSSLLAATAAGLALGCVSATPASATPDPSADPSATTVNDETLVLAATGRRAAGEVDVAQPQRTVLRRHAIEPITAVLPVSGYDLTGTFGDSGGSWSSTHTGLDFAAAYGSPVAAVVAGDVISADVDSSFGLKVVVEADDGSVWWYCHLGEAAVGAGDRVEPGTRVGSIGLTGNTTGPHLHLEVHRGDPVDPYGELAERGVTP